MSDSSASRLKLPKLRHDCHNRHTKGQRVVTVVTVVTHMCAMMDGSMEGDRDWSEVFG
jgi:hypothetical protein